MTEQELQRAILKAQKDEITEHLIYKKLAGIVKKPEQVEILNHISREEL